MVDRTALEAMRPGADPPAGPRPMGVTARGWCAGTTVTSHWYL